MAEPPELTDELNSVGVFARFRPGADAPRDKSIVVRKRYGTQQDVQVRNLEFSLDYIFDTDASQEEVYEIVAEQRVARVVQGYNVCLLAYGQTGSGKTHTIYGPDKVLDDYVRNAKVDEMVTEVAVNTEGKGTVEGLAVVGPE